VNRIIRGVAIVYDAPTEIAGSWVEIIAPGAAKDTLRKSRSIRAFSQHDTGSLLADTHNGSLALFEKADGVHFELALPDTTLGRDTFELVKRRDLRSMSFAFKAVREEWSNLPGYALPVRTVLELNLFEISPVTYPAYEQTEVKA